MSSTTTRESEWDEQQQGWVLALALYRAGLCPCGCGHPMAMTTAFEDTVSVTVPPPLRCLARDAILVAQKQHDRERPEALLWRSEIKPRG